MSHIISAKITGKPDLHGWTQVHDFLPTDSEKRAQRGHFFAIISLHFASNEITSELTQINIGREILTRLHEEYFGRLELTAFDALSQAVAKVAAEFESQDMSVHIGALSILESVIYAASSPNVEFYLLRQGTLVPLITKETKRSISGYIKPEDSFILGTAEFFQEVGAGVLKGALQSGDFSQASETLTPSIHIKPNASILGAAILKEHAPEAVFIGQKKENKISSPFPKIEVRSKLVSLVDSVLTNIPDRKITVHSDTIEIGVRKKRKNAAFVGVLLLMLLITSIIFGIKARNTKTAKQRYEPVLNQAIHEFEEAQSLQSLNPERARELALSARTQATKMKDEGVQDERLESLLASMQQNIGKITGFYEVASEPYLDLSLISNGFVGSDIAFSDEYIYVLDGVGKKLVRIAAGTKKTEVLAGPDYLPDALSLAAYADKGYILSSDGVRQVNGEIELSIKDRWSNESSLMGAFAANIYILDKNESIIWRYPAVASGFADKSEWLAPGISPNFSEIISWAIDGSIWFLGNGGRVLKYTQGAQQTFSVPSTISISQVKQLFTAEGLESLYLLDTTNGRVLVIDKNGEYKAEYSGATLKEADKIVVSENEKKIFVLQKDKLFTSSLTHLE